MKYTSGKFFHIVQRRTSLTHGTNACITAALVSNHKGAYKKSHNIMARSSEKTVRRGVSHLDDSNLCKTIDIGQILVSHHTKLVAIKRDEALNQRLPVVYLGFEYRGVQEPERRGFAVKPTAKYVDECLELVPLQNAEPVTPLTEKKSANLQDEIPACDQAEHALFRPAVGKLQYIIGLIKLSLPFVTLCLSYKLPSHTLADYTCEEGAKIFEGNTTLEFLLYDSCTETAQIEQAIEEHHWIL